MLCLANIQLLPDFLGRASMRSNSAVPARALGMTAPCARTRNSGEFHSPFAWLNFLAAAAFPALAAAT
jgi:hypothetical protein